MPTFLLDANLSPKTARFLADRFGLDVLVLRGARQHRLSDPEVIALAHAHGRVIITLDRDYAAYFFRTARPVVGIIYLDLPNTHRFVPEINRLLERFFSTLEADLDLEHALVTITEASVSIVHRP